MIAAAGLSRAFNGRPAVEDLTFEVPSGALCALLGPNGAGKTTTVRLLMGLIGPSAGGATVAGLRIGADAATNAAIRRTCGLLTETPGFYDRLSAWDNLRFFGRLYGLDGADLDGRLRRYLDLMELWERRDEMVATFSKGMKQRLAIIRAVFHDPKVVFLDEPTSGLDPEAALGVRELILRLKGEGRTIVVCTHNLDEAERLADIVGVMKRRLLLFARLDDLRAERQGPGTVAIEVRVPGEACELALRGLPCVTSVALHERSYRIGLTDQREIPAAVRALADASAAILRVEPEASTLEALYLSAVREED